MTKKLHKTDAPTLHTATGERILEVCCSNAASVAAAVQGGAPRIELCAALALDGLTPSIGLLRWARANFPQLCIHVLIRPHEGCFVYDRTDLDVMERDIGLALPWCDGIVSGALTAGGDVDLPAMRRLMSASGGKPFTFHRAFDVCRNPELALRQLADLGCARILTSGQSPTASHGIALLRQLHEQSHGRIIIMPGGGVNPDNAREILDRTGCREIHGSCSATGVTDADTVRHIICRIV